MGTRIISYCKIKHNTVVVNGETLVKSDVQQEHAAFLSGLYKTFDLNYPKFFKMDRLCKLGILATELLIRNTPDFPEFPKNKIALVFSNEAASLETDRNHAATIADKDNYFPSPSVFVYTLPNIVIGEIAIKYKITGENAFFVSRKFDADLMHMYTENLLQDKSASTVIAGWVDVDGSEMEAFVYCVKNTNFKQENEHFPSSHNSKNIQHLYSL